MKNINRLLAAAAILLSAAACQTSEIDNPGHTDPVNPGEPGLTISASIVKTRVTYSDMDDDMYDNGYLHQQWEEGDILFGYYDGKVTNQVILKVDYLDSEDDYNAILVPVECNGVATLKDLADLNEEVNVDLVYTGKNLKDFKDQDGILNETELLELFDLTVDFSSQDGIRIPACMHARAPIVVDEDDENKKSLFFKFVNDCAIIEICSLTGIKNLGLTGDVSLTSLAVSNLVLDGKYTFGDNGFELEASEFEFGSDVPKVNNYEKGFESSDKWCVDKDGNIYYDGSTEKRYLIAVVPNNYLKEIKVSASIDYNNNPGPHVFPYGKHSFDSGMCYVICKEEVVAKTVDGVYFSTVAAAFDHAAEIAEELEGDPTKYGGKNIVTLVKENITGLGDHPEPSYVQDDDFSDGTDDSYYDASLMVEIDYDVTLDLNGCTLSLINADVAAKDKSECFYVDPYDGEDATEGYLTIKDSRSGGAIESESFCHMIYNEGKVTIENGKIKHISEVDGWCAVKNWGELNVMDGELYSNLWTAITNDGGELTINDGKVYSSSSSGYAVENKGDLYVYGGEVYTNGSGAAIYSDCSANPGAIVTIGGTENNASGPCIHNDSYGFPAIYIIGPNSSGTEVTFTMNQGLVYGSSGALVLKGKIKSYINGGELASGYKMWTGEGQTLSYSTITLKTDVLSCEISGGKIISGNYGQSSVTCEGSNVALSIKWTGTNRSEPLLYSHCSKGELIPPINMMYKCTLNIEGGLIYEGATIEGHNYIFNSTGTGSTFSLSDFYSNKLQYRAKIKTTIETPTVSNYSENYAKKVSASDINIKGVITIDETELNFYHIEPPAESPSAPGQTSKYYFDSFGW